jgi:predicted DNA-binding transcriptional regulator AlpA
VAKHSDRIVGSTVRIQLGKFRPRDLTESMEAGSVGATLVSFGWVSVKPEDGMNLSQIPKSVARDTPDPANGEAQDGQCASSVGSSTEEPCDKDGVASRARLSGTCLLMPPDKANEPENWGVEDDLTDSPLPEALWRKPDSHASRDPDPPGRKLNVREAARFLGLSASTLNKMRLNGNGPPYLKLGRRVLYDVHDLQAWAASRRRNHTSE